MSARRVLITGAGGFVGRALATGFADLGWRVTGVDRTFDGGRVDPRVDRVLADLGSEGVPARTPHPELVIHGAWVTTDPDTLGITVAEYVALNLRPLLAVLEYAAGVRVPSFVFLSSSGVFGPDHGGTGLTDTDRPEGSSPYAVAKRAGELLVETALNGAPGRGLGESGAMGAHVVRLGHLFGPGETARPSRAGVSLVARWIEAARAGRPLEVRADDPLRDWTFAADLAPALARVVAGPAGGHPLHLGSGQVLSDGALAGLVADAVPGAEVVRVPADGGVKPPMLPSRVPGLQDLPWTTIADGVRSLLAGDAEAPVPRRPEVPMAGQGPSGDAARSSPIPSPEVEA